MVSVLTSENGDITRDKHKHKKNEQVRSSCAYAYAAGVLTCLRWPNTVCARFTDSVSDAFKRALRL